jgi:hypothetical protein
LRDFLALDTHDVWGSTGAALELISLLSELAPLIAAHRIGYWR